MVVVRPSPLAAERKRGQQKLPETWERLAAERATAAPPPPGVHRGNRLSLKRGTDGRLAVTCHAVAVDDLPAFVAQCERHFKLAKK